MSRLLNIICKQGILYKKEKNLCHGMDEKTNIRNQIIRSDASVVFGLLATGEEGLTASEAAKRLET